ncbi:hypothetical protein ACFX2A_000181 [Malus domestica]
MATRTALFNSSNAIEFRTLFFSQTPPIFITSANPQASSQSSSSSSPSSSLRNSNLGSIIVSSVVNLENADFSIDCV